MKVTLIAVSMNLRSVPAVLIPLVLLAGASIAQQTVMSQRQVSYAGVVPNRWTAPKWTAGMLLTTDPSGRAADYNLIAWSPERGIVGKFRIWPDGADLVGVEDMVASNREVIAAVGFARVGSIQSGFLALIRLADGKIRFVQTSPLFPEAVVFAPDSTIWVSGKPLTPDGRSRAEFGDYRLLQHYDAEGRLLEEHLPHSAFQCGPGNHSRLAVSGNRIGLLLPQCARWIELDLSGKVVGSWPYRSRSNGQRVQAVVMTDDGAVYLVETTKDNPGLLRLNHQSGAWEGVPDLPVRYILGADGGELVASIAGSGRNYLTWVKPPSE